MFQKRTFNILVVSTVFVLLLLTGCGPDQTAVSPSAAPGDATATTAGVLPTATTQPTPTATLEPQALRVNGEGISIAEYEAELRQLQEAHQALGKEVPQEDQRKQVLENLTDTLLLAQGAFESGFQVDDAALQAEMDRLAQQLTAKTGSGQALQAWMTQRGYTEVTFRAALKRSLAAAWQRDQLAAAVPSAGEQIRARQILTQDEENARQALERVKEPGVNFAAYAAQYDPLTSGDLGWFPRGYLTQPEVEEAVFQLEPGQISPVIQSQIGYHIVQVISREPSRQISPDALRVLQHKAIQDWLKASREGGQIEVLLP